MPRGILESLIKVNGGFSMFKCICLVPITSNLNWQVYQRWKGGGEQIQTSWLQENSVGWSRVGQDSCVFPSHSHEVKNHLMRMHIALQRLLAEAYILVKRLEDAPRWRNSVELNCWQLHLFGYEDVAESSLLHLIRGFKLTLQSLVLGARCPLLLGWAPKSDGLSVTARIFSLIQCDWLPQSREFY